MNPDWRNDPATEQQKEKLRFFGCTWDDGITAGQASDALEECAKQFPGVEAAYQNRLATPEQVVAAPSQEITIQEAETSAITEPVRREGFFFGAPEQNASPRKYIIPARVVQDYVQREANQEPATYTIPSFAEKTVNDLLKAQLTFRRLAKWRLFNNLFYRLSKLQLSSFRLRKNKPAILPNGCYWLPLAKAASLTFIVAETKITIGRCRLIADKIEAAGYCVEPDVRFGSGAYEWNQTLGLFKPFDGDPAKPSAAYVGAANLLRLCVIVAAADGKVDKVEVDVFRQVIENQLDLSQTDHQRLLVLEQLLTQGPSLAAKTLAKVAQSVPIHKRLLIGKVLVRVAAADTVITKDERRALERIFKAFEISPGVLEKLLVEQVPTMSENLDESIQAPRVSEKFAAQSVNGEKIFNVWTDAKTFVRTGHVLIFSHAQHWWLITADSYREFADVKIAELISHPPGAAIRELHDILTGKVMPHQTCPPSQEVTIQEAGTGATSRRIPERVSTPPPQSFALDMTRVYEITSETKEVVAILSVLMEDEPGKSIAPSATITLPAPEIPKVSGDSNAAPQPTRFNGLDAAFHPILERLLARNSWPKNDFKSLADEFHFMPLSIRDTLNEWADEELGDFILDGEDPVIIRRELIGKEKVYG